MPFPIVSATALSSNVKRLVIQAPHITRRCQAGQFVIVRAAVDGERIPLTVANTDKAAGTITLVVQAIGLTTRLLAAKEAGDTLPDVAGPMGKATHIPEGVQHVVLVGGGVGTAVIYPQALALKAGMEQRRVKVSAIIGGRTKDLVILEEELGKVCDAVYPCTDDGSYGFKGLVTARLAQLMEEEKAGGVAVDMVITAGPVPMMRAVAETTRPSGVHTVASLNPIMVDGTGMCGGCRVQVGGKMMFACVDGPEFDAHAVDFKELSDRLTAYRAMEKDALERHVCASAGQ